ncbi:MAG: efflux RND transporter periplasmic adaptor subunit [Luteolibacter sp.]
MKTLLTILITASLTAAAAWWLLKPDTTPSASSRQPLYYQSAMHPWIRSDKPGRCTICGMELTPVYAETENAAAAGKNLVTLTHQQTKILGVRTSAAKKQPLVRHLDVTGVIDDDETRHRILSAYVPGRIDKLTVNYLGAEVTEGEPLAEIYSPQLLQAEREYRQLSGELKRAAALRLRQMGLTPGQIHALDEKPAEALTSQLLAPMTGTVVAREIYEGQYVETGEKLFEIADFSTMWFRFDAYEQDLSWLEIGQPVKVTATSLPGKTFEGKISFIEPSFNEATRSTKVRVELPNPDLLLKHRVTADGRIEVRTEDVLTIPKSAVIQTGTEAWVYVDQQGDTYEQRLVSLGRRGDLDVEVTGGLSEGENVVTTGTVLIDGQAELQHPTHREQTSAEASPALTPAQQAALRDFLTTSDAMSAALADDDLEKFNTAKQHAGHVTQAFTTAFGDFPKLAAASDFPDFTEIKKAREAFFNWSMPAVETLLELQVPLEGFQLWECPMVHEAIPIPGKLGRWIQSANREGRNPYFGKAMLNCGDPIKGGAR